MSICRYSYKTAVTAVSRTLYRHTFFSTLRLQVRLRPFSIWLWKKKFPSPTPINPLLKRGNHKTQQILIPKSHSRHSLTPISSNTKSLGYILLLRLKKEKGVPWCKIWAVLRIEKLEVGQKGYLYKVIFLGAAHNMGPSSEPSLQFLHPSHTLPYAMQWPPPQWWSVGFGQVRLPDMRKEMMFSSVHIFRTRYIFDYFILCTDIRVFFTYRTFTYNAKKTLQCGKFFTPVIERLPDGSVFVTWSRDVICERSLTTHDGVFIRAVLAVTVPIAYRTVFHAVATATVVVSWIWTGSISWHKKGDAVFTVSMSLGNIYYLHALYAHPFVP